MSVNNCNMNLFVHLFDRLPHRSEPIQSVQIFISSAISAEINKRPLIGNASEVIIDTIGIRRGERGETIGKGRFRGLRRVVTHRGLS